MENTCVISGFSCVLKKMRQSLNEQAKRVLTHTSLDWATCGNGLKPG